MADQLTWSLTNFALSITIARSVSVEEFGEFTLVYWTYLLLLNLGRAFGSHPLWVVASHVGGERWRNALADSVGFVLVISVVIGLGLIGVGLALGGPVLAFSALGLGLPGLLVHDSYRFGMIADGRARLSFGSDLTWAIVMGILLGVFVFGGASGGVPVLILIWAAGAYAGALYAMWACGVLPSPRRARAWLRDNARLIPGFSVAGLSEPVAQTAIQFILAATVGLAAVGAIRAGQLLMSPITVAFQGVFAVLGPEASKLLREQRSSFARRMAAIAALLASLSLAYGLVALLLPGSIGQSLLGDSWDHARDVLPFLIVVVAANGAASAASLGLLVGGAANTLAKLAVTTYSLMVLCAVVGGVVAGTTGAAAGLALAYIVLFIANWTVFLRADRRPGGLVAVEAGGSPLLGAVDDPGASASTPGSGGLSVPSRPASGDDTD
ncbi:MAG: hypothetical protein AB1Z67_01115 [Candidatus Limnocylindrales bacterium]